MRKPSKTSAGKTVDDYLRALPVAVRTSLEKLRKTIEASAPMAEEVISYQIPTYKYIGALVHFAAFKDHCSFYVVSKDVLKIFAKELKPFDTSGTTIHFAPDKPLPATLVKKIVKLRIKQNEERSAETSAYSKSTKP